jgi:hypothetical protein
MKYLIAILLISLLQTVPFKPKEEFEVKLDYQFKARPAESVNSVHFETTRNQSSSLLPYLILNVNVLKADASRIKITNNRNRNFSQKKLKDGDIIPLDLGFTDDVKDQVTANEYTLTFLDAERMPVSRVDILVDKDGNFFVNGERRGKF